MRLRHAALLLCLLGFACDPPAPPGAGTVALGPSRELSTFTLPRLVQSATVHPLGTRAVIVDAEVVRLLDETGYELWGRRLSPLGTLRSAAFCLGGVAVVGEKGAALLAFSGLARSWPDGASVVGGLSIVGDDAACYILRGTEVEEVRAETRKTHAAPAGTRGLVVGAGGVWSYGEELSRVVGGAARFSAPGGPFRAAAASSDGEWFAAADGSRVFLWDKQGALRWQQALSLDAGISFAENALLLGGQGVARLRPGIDEEARPVPGTEGVAAEHLFAAGSYLVATRGAELWAWRL